MVLEYEIIYSEITGIQFSGIVLKEGIWCVAKGIAFILRNLTDSEDEMFSIINTGNYSAEKYRKKYRKNHKKYINYINEILDDKANGYFTNIEALDEKEALINYKFQLKEQFANGKCTNDYFRIVNSIMHMYCNRLTGNRELEEEYFALVRHAWNAAMLCANRQTFDLSVKIPGSVHMSVNYKEQTISVIGSDNQLKRLYKVTTDANQS